jgi:calcium-dependent protein kinase
VVRFFEFYQDATQFYLVTEYTSACKRRYCAGGDLLAKMKQALLFTEAKAAMVMRQILGAVDYCHKQNIVHRYLIGLLSRDLKPENIVFDGPAIQSTLKIIDFGRSKLLLPREVTTEKAGSVPLILHPS